MVSRRPFPLCSKAFLRVEEDVHYLFHGESGAVIELGADPLELLESPDPEVRGTVHSTLAEQGFIDGEEAAAAASPEPDRRLSRDELREIDYRFNSLRSSRAPFFVLWGLAGRCNLRCVYCFPDIINTAPRLGELSTSEALAVARKIVEAAVFEVTLSGGEPLLRGDIFEIAALLREHNLRVSMMSNGTLLTGEHARRAKELDLAVGISIDSMSEEINRITRGAGVVDKVKRAVETLKSHEVESNLVVTVTRHNFDHLDAVFEYARQMQMDSIILQDLRGFGTREIYQQTRLTDAQEDAVPALIDRLEADFPELYVVTLELLMYKRRELTCPSGGFSLYINPAGDVFPCNALPTYKMGNAVRDDLLQLWQRSPAITRLREGKGKMPATCAGCDQWTTCQGGCRGDAIFFSGEQDGLPSRCPRARCSA
jgi:pyrroloquinoline quinone biosynthesis protein E